MKGTVPKCQFFYGWDLFPNSHPPVNATQYLQYVESHHRPILYVAVAENSGPHFLKARHVQFILTNIKEMDYHHRITEFYQQQNNGASNSERIFCFLALLCWNSTWENMKAPRRQWADRVQESLFLGCSITIYSISLYIQLNVQLFCGLSKRKYPSVTAKSVAVHTTECYVFNEDMERNWFVS